MSICTQLYLNTRWELDDIKTVIERVTGDKVEVKSNHDTSIGFYWFLLTKKKRQISVFTNNRTPIGSTTYLSMGANDEGHKILKAIAEVFGGIYVDNDCDGKCELINGNIDDGDALAYFLKYAIVDDGIKKDDLKGFIKSMNQWYDRINKGVNPLDKPDSIQKALKGFSK
jgi:hypothetical protein